MGVKPGKNGGERPPGSRAKYLILLIKQRLAGGLGFEPRQAESESAVLPLDDPPSISTTCQNILEYQHILEYRLHRLKARNGF